MLKTSRIADSFSNTPGSNQAAPEWLSFISHRHCVMMINPGTDQNIVDLNNSIGTSRRQEEPILRKFCATLQPGKSVYDIRHRLGSEDVLVQTRIAGRIREGGISIVDPNCVRLTFGGTLNEFLDVVIIG